MDRQIARLAVPAFLALVSEPLYLLADAAIVGHLGTSQLGGLGVAGAVVQTAVGMFVFLAYGTTAAVARSLGAGDSARGLRNGIDGIWLALAIGTVVGGTVLALTPQTVDAFGPSPEVRQFAVTYLRIAALGIPSLLVVLAATGVVRGLQDTITPLVVVVASNVANIALNLALVYGLGLGIAGSAVGTLIAQTGAALALTAVVVRHARRRAVALRPHRRGLRQSAGSGVALVIRTLCLRAALLVSTWVAVGIGTTAVAAHQVAFTIWSFLAFALDAIAIAGQAITGQLLGAGDSAGAVTAARRMMGWGLLAGTVAGALLIALRSVVGSLFTPDHAVQHTLASVLLVAALHQPISGVVFVLDGVLIGAGDGRFLAVASAVTLAVFVPLALAVRWSGEGLTTLWWAFSAFMLARMLTLLWRERSGRWLVLGASR